LIFFSHGVCEHIVEDNISIQVTEDKRMLKDAYCGAS